MAAHENLAGGLIGAAGALFAAWLAFSAIQQQIAEEQTRRERDQIEGKLTAIMAVTHPVHAAASTLGAITKAIAAPAAEIAQRDAIVAQGASFIQGALDQVLVREIVRDMSVDDRAVYVAIVSNLATYVNINAQPSPILDRVQRLTNQREHLLKLRPYLSLFHDELARVYDREGGISDLGREGG